MSRWLVRAGLLGGALGLSYWGWIVLFPGPARIIQMRLAHIARLASVAPNEGALARMINSQKLAGFCTSDVEISIDLPGRVEHRLNGRDELLQAVLAASSTVSPLKIDFLDIGVLVGTDNQSAVAHLTAKASFPGERIPEVQELTVDFRKVGRDWLIAHAETVKTLH
jgi:hypothetical protein